MKRHWNLVDREIRANFMNLENLKEKAKFRVDFTDR